MIIDFNLIVVDFSSSSIDYIFYFYFIRPLKALLLFSVTGLMSTSLGPNLHYVLNKEVSDRNLYVAAPKPHHICGKKKKQTQETKWEQVRNRKKIQPLISL